MRRQPVLVLLLLLLGLAACGGPKTPEEVEPALPPVAVEVKNLYALPVEITARGNASFYHLGTVHPGMTGSFSVPANLTLNGSVELMVSPNTNIRPFLSGPLLLSPGAIVDVVVTPRLFNSTATIRN